MRLHRSISEICFGLTVGTLKRKRRSALRPALTRCSRKLGTIFPTCWTSRAGQKPQSIVCAVRSGPRRTMPTRYKSVVQGAIAYFGTYTVNEADHTLNFHIERCTFPNWDGTDQKRSITITGDEMKYTNTAASGGGKAELVWKRAK